MPVDAAKSSPKPASRRARKQAGAFVVQMNQRGTLTLPKELRDRFGLDQAGQVVVDATAEGVRIRPAVTYPVEIYSDERIAHFLKHTEGALRGVRFK